MHSSSTLMSIHESAFDTPMRSAKRRKPAAVKPRRRAPIERGQARVVPAVDMAFVHELDQLALGQHHVGQVEAGELDLLRQRAREAALVASASSSQS